MLLYIPLVLTIDGVSVSVKYVATSRSLALMQGMGVRNKNKKLVAVGFGRRLLECLSTT